MACQDKQVCLTNKYNLTCWVPHGAQHFLAGTASKLPQLLPFQKIALELCSRSLPCLSFKTNSNPLQVTVHPPLVHGGTLILVASCMLSEWDLQLSEAGPLRQPLNILKLRGEGGCLNLLESALERLCFSP